MMKLRYSDIQYGIEGLELLRDASECQGAGLDYKELVRNHVSTDTLEIDISEYRAFLDVVGYFTNYAWYVDQFVAAYERLGHPRDFVNRKFIEQYIATLITNPKEGDTAVDIAAWTCPLSQILKRDFRIKTSYHQDLTHLPTHFIDELRKSQVEFVRGNAAHLPFSDDSLNYMYLLNSWEHFQPDFDLGILKEAERCLQKRGKIVILPLNGSSKTYVTTDRSVWNTKQVVEKGKPPRFRRHVPVLLRENVQTYAQCHGAEILVEFFEQVPLLKFEILSVKFKGVEPAWFKGSWDVLIGSKLA